jgi:hypothetical protein
MKILHLYFYALVSLNLFFVCAWARAETFCERNWAQYQGGGAWDRRCGPEPGKAYREELIKDCSQTRAQIRSREGASWNSEWGWAAEDQCEAAGEVRT